MLLMIVPGAALAAFAIAAIVRWTYGDGIGSRSLRPIPFGIALSSLTVAALWRIANLREPVWLGFDVVLGILAAMLLVAIVRAAWIDRRDSSRPRKQENTPWIVLVGCALLVAAFALVTFGCLPFDFCASPSHIAFTGDAPLPPGGTHVDVLPPGFE
jgi:hypothetical protein